MEKVIRSLVHLRDTYPRRKKDCPRTEVFSGNGIDALRGAQGTRSAIGSGVTEAVQDSSNATHEEVRNAWGEQGGQAILSFRALVQSNRFERALAHTYKAEVTTLDNVVPIRSWQ